MSQDTARIMIVEDEFVVASDLENRLQMMGYEVCSHAATGEAAVEMALADPPHLILMDINLQSPIDGIQAADRIHQVLPVPIIFLTAYGDDDCVARAKSAEPYGYILKPLDDRELKINIEVCLYRSRLEEERRRYQEEREKLIAELQKALSEVHTLRGFIPICSVCKKIRDDDGYWQRLEKYIQDRADVLFSHSLCPDCARERYPELFDKEE